MLCDLFWTKNNDKLQIRAMEPEKMECLPVFTVMRHGKPGVRSLFRCFSDHGVRSYKYPSFITPGTARFLPTFPISLIIPTFLMHLNKLHHPVPILSVPIVFNPQIPGWENGRSGACRLCGRCRHWKTRIFPQPQPQRFLPGQKAPQPDPTVFLAI